MKDLSKAKLVIFNEVISNCFQKCALSKLQEKNPIGSFSISNVKENRTSSPDNLPMTIITNLKKYLWIGILILSNIGCCSLKMDHCRH